MEESLWIAGHPEEPLKEIVRQVTFFVGISGISMRKLGTGPE